MLAWLYASPALEPLAAPVNFSNSAAAALILAVGLLPIAVPISVTVKGLPSAVNFLTAMFKASASFVAKFILAVASAIRLSDALLTLFTAFGRPALLAAVLITSPVFIPLASSLTSLSLTCADEASPDWPIASTTSGSAFVLAKDFCIGAFSLLRAPVAIGCCAVSKSVVRSRACWAWVKISC